MPLFMRHPLSHRDVEASLLHFVFNVAAVGGAQIVEHFAEHPFKRIVAYTTAGRTVGILNRFVAIVGNIERSAIAMAAIFGRIAVMSAQCGHVCLAAQHARDDESM